MAVYLQHIRILGDYTSLNKALRGLGWDIKLSQNGQVAVVPPHFAGQHIGHLEPDTIAYSGSMKQNWALVLDTKDAFLFACQFMREASEDGTVGPCPGGAGLQWPMCLKKA